MAGDHFGFFPLLPKIMSLPRPRLLFVAVLFITPSTSSSTLFNHRSVRSHGWLSGIHRGGDIFDDDNSQQHPPTKESFNKSSNVIISPSLLACDW